MIYIGHFLTIELKYTSVCSPMTVWNALLKLVPVPWLGIQCFLCRRWQILNANDKDQWAWNRTHPASVWRHLFCFIIYRKSPNVRVVRNTSCFVPLLAVLNRLLVMATQCHIDHCWPLIQLFSMQVDKYLLRRPNGRLLLY